MKVSSRIDGSICGAILLHRPSWTSVLLATASARTRTDTATRRYHSTTTPTGRSPSRRCPYLRRPLLTVPVLLRRSSIHNGSFFRPSLPASCTNHTATGIKEPDATDDAPRPPPAPAPTKPMLSKPEILALVDSYAGEDPGTVEEHLQFFRDPYMRGYADSSAPNVIVAKTKHDVDYPCLDEVTEPDEDGRKILWDLRFAVLTRLRSPNNVDLDSIYHIYQQLPEPRITYIHGRLRHLLLKALGQPEKRNSKSMLRYFAVIADVRDSGLALTTAEWNAAISFASRYVGTTTEAETESALRLWHEMETQAGVKATDVTFNILFDAASKAGNFGLAEMVYREMENRGHRPNRYHYVSLIHFFGLKLDTIALRAAYREMVNAGEIIDTVALNAVISGLLRAGEQDAAERVYERMLKVSVTAAAASAAPDAGGDYGNMAEDGGNRLPVMPTRNYLSNRVITQALTMLARLGRRHRSIQPLFQNNVTLIHPDLHTYRIMINHFGVNVGDIGKVARFIDEMKFFQIPLHGAIFLALFKGFALHGGYRRSAWSEQRLESIWSAFLTAMDDHVEGLEIKTWLAMWVLKAFQRCSPHTPGRVMRVYEDLKGRWRLRPADEEFMADFFTGLVN
ncbi:hypothetical protein B0H66DRAFT_501139 [Apodospora peruviana]|uniref:Pentatricopeptide repeat protein n=1 Tax=Apodospora peruviana TaxID=516989 RepID=A0AAE0HXE4_9PEZI|nr:hypothetical protein B0H66DRAFT_501139 [Apodospora peruviana]